MFVLVLAGPTAVGKSELGLALAQRLGGEILCADSMQVYRLMDIGTAKPTRAERSMVPHHLLDLVSPDEPFSAAQYAAAFHDSCRAVARRNRLPIVVGGTGLYIRAAVRPFLFPDAGCRPELRAALQAIAAREGPAVLHARLAEADPEAAGRIHPHDVRRVVRALEVFEATGRPISDWQRDRQAPSAYEPLFVALTRERAELYERIDARAERMIGDGFVEEVRSLLARGYDPALPSMQGLGYRELCRVLHGEYSLVHAVDEIKKRTRNYAKRQLTWLGREQGARWFDLSTRREAAVLGEIFRLVAGRWEAPSNN